MNNYLSHADIEAILKEGPKAGSLHKAYMAHTDFEPREYGFYDKDNLGKDTDELPAIATDSIGFSREVKIAPKAPKIPTWVNKIWNGITVMPNGRLSSNILDTVSIEPSLYTLGDEKLDKIASASSYFSVVAESFYVKMKLDRDDVLDLADFDVVSYIKAVMQGKMKEYLATLFLTGDESVSSIVPIVSADADEVEVATDNILTYSVGNEDLSLIIKRSSFNEAVSGFGIASLSNIAEFIGVKEIIPVPDDLLGDTIAILYDLSKYCVGLPKGLNGDFFSDFDIDYNTYKVMLETKVCGLPCDKGFVLTAE